MNLRECQPISTRLDSLLADRQNDIYRDFDISQIYGHFSPENQQLLSFIDSDFRFFLGSLNKVQRWQYHQFQRNIDNLPLVDTDYSHVSRMLQTKDQIQNIPISNINFNDVELMILLHDGGEIITGDICQNDPLKKQKEFMKDIETRSFPLLILRQLKKENIPLRTRFSQIYQRYNLRDKNPSDSESHLVKLIDHFDGNSFGMKYVYDKSILESFYPNSSFPIDPNKLVDGIINLELQQLILFLKSLSSPTDRSKFISYYRQNWLINYSLHGYQQLTIVAEKELDKLNQF